MGKTHVPHRIVTRDSTGSIVEDLEYPSFARAKPDYDEAAARVSPGMSVSLQHGARVVMRTEECE